jgi:short-subunit dehydrogenase
MNSQGKNGVALITGASAGIGATYADRLARRGHDLILVARDGQRLENLAARLRAEAGVNIEVLPADLTRRPDLLRIEQRLAADPAITVLVNNAGVAGSRGILSEDPDRLEAMIQLNVVAVTRLAATAATAFATRRHGIIINLASVVALAPERFSGPYSGTKAYVLNFSQSLQQEVSGLGVRVQAVLPGATRTEIWERAGFDISQIDPDILMDVGEMVDAALAGLDQGELVTIPSLPDIADWEALTAARLHLGPNLSRNHAAARYKTGAAETV